MTAPQAAKEIAAARALFELLPETGQVYSIWEGLIAKHAVLGKRAHDVRLVALMIQYRVARLLTFNDADFRAFTEIQALNPLDVMALPRI